MQTNEMQANDMLLRARFLLVSPNVAQGYTSFPLGTHHEYEV